MAPLIAAGVALAAEFVPSLIRHFAGDKAGEVAEKVVGAAQALTGAGTPDAAAEVLRTKPELALAFRKDMAELELETERAYLADRQNARNRDIELAKVGKLNWRADAMVVVAFAAVCVIAALLALGGIDGNTAAGGFLISVGGMFARNIGTAFDFEFGSSRGSKIKDETLSKLS